MNIPYVMKRCSKCGEWKVASTVNFSRAKKGRYGLASQCKKCRNKYAKQYYEANRDKMAELRNQWYEANPEYNKQYRENNKDKIAEQQKQYREANKEKIAERHKQYYEANKEKELERVKQWQEANRDKVAEKNKRWREANRDKVAEKNKRYRQSPKGQVAAFNCHHRRRAREEQQGTGITKDQWLEMMKFFDFRCAYSDEYIGGDSFNRTIDHIVPLDAGGDNMIWNCVPMTRSLNSSKHTNNMEEWYKEQDCYDPKRLQKIYEWQEFAYNKWGKDTQYFNSGDIQIKLL